MTVRGAIEAGYRVERCGKAWTLYQHGMLIFGAWRVTRLLAFIECREMVKRVLRHGMRKV